MAYLRRFSVTLFALLGVVAALNAVMDATGLLGMPVIRGINDAKAPGKDRFFKPLEVELRQPRTVFIGTSRVAVGFDPHDLSGADAYNLGLLGSTVPEHIAFARYAVDYAPVERVLFGLDYASFGDFNRYSSAFRLAILGPFAFWRALPDLLLSQSQLLQSRITLTLSRRHVKPRFADDGMLIAANELRDSPDPAVRVLRKVEQYARFYHWLASPEQTLGELDDFLAALPPRVAVTVFVTPAHVAMYEALRPAGLEGAYEDWLRRVTEICAAHHVPLWDFNGYNRITTEPFATSDADYIDGAHTRPEVGRLMLATMLQGAKIPDFGVRLTPDMLAEYLATQRMAAAAWRRAQPVVARRAAEAAARADALEAKRGNTR